MKFGLSILPKGLAGKLTKFVVVFALAMGVLSMAIFGVHLSRLQNLSVLQEQKQLELIHEKSKASMIEITEKNLISLNASAIERTDDEFKIVKNDLLALRSQVEDVFKHPENYEPKEISAPKLEDGDKPVMQLLAPDGYENISPETYDMMTRLANLEPMMKEIVLAEDYIIDSYISTLDGVTLTLDRLSYAKFDEDGNIKRFDARERGWFKGALETGDVYFSSTIKSSLYGFKEIVYGVPVYVDNQPVAVLEGCLHVEGMFAFMNVSDREIGESGFSILVSKDGQLSSSPRQEGELKLSDDMTLDIRDSVNHELKNLINKGLSGLSGIERVHVDGEEYYGAYGCIPTAGWAQIIFVSVHDLMEPADSLITDIENNSNELIEKENKVFKRSVIIVLIALLVAMIVSNILVSIRAKKFAAPIVHMTERLSEITGANMFFEMDDIYRTDDEIEILAQSFETMAEKMQHYVDEIVDEISEKERVKTELTLASKIQEDMLPNIFPAFPDRHEFNIYASMTPAKELGGDFYDFFFAGENILALVMADVSGKGIPAAMFMMMAKSLIQSEIIAKKNSQLVLEDVNNLIHFNNPEKMYVSVWIGLLDVSTGILTASNAGQQCPMLMEPGEDFKIVNDKQGHCLGKEKNAKYLSYEIKMKPGSKIFVYTDGVISAKDKAGNTFELERMEATINSNNKSSAKDILDNVEKEIRKFAKDGQQSDDMSMLCLEYFGV